MRRIKGLPPCLTEAVPASSKTDSLLLSLEPISRVLMSPLAPPLGGDSMKTYLRKGKALHRK